MKSLKGYWRLAFPLLCLWIFMVRPATSLLEERFIAFSDSDGSIPIHSAVIIHDSQDPAGVRIAADSLVNDFEQITGSRPKNATWDTDSGPLGNGTAIIIGTVESDLIKAIVENGKLEVDDIDGKWETFKTSVVSEPLSGVKEALVIAGSDMRGTAFGVYTLADQAGQSP